MLDFLRRHHKTFWIVVTTVVIISFVFWGASTKTGGGRGTDVDTAFVTVYGRDYDRNDIDRLVRFQNLASFMGMSEFARDLGRMAGRFGFLGQSYPLDFAINLIVLRDQAEKYGVQVSDAEANETFRKLPAFQTKEGEFDGNRARQFEDQMLGPLGFHSEDVITLMRDYVTYQKLEKIVGGNVVENPAISEKSYAERFQSIRAQNIPFALDDFKKKGQVADDEISKYFDQHKANFMTEPKRAVSYVLFPQLKDLDKATTEQKNAEAKKVSDFSNATIHEPQKFAELAKAAGLEVHTVPAFAEESPPDALKDEPALVADIFKNDRAALPVSDPVQGKDGYYIFTVTNVEEAKQQELKDVKDKIKDTLLAQKAQETMMKEASDVRKKLEDALKAGKNFADAAKEAGVQPQPIAEFTPFNPPPNLSNARFIVKETIKTPAGALTAPIPAEHGVILVYVESKVLYKSEDSASRKQSLGHFDDSMLANQVFQTWFEKRRDEANARPHFKMDQNG